MFDFQSLDEMDIRQHRGQEGLEESCGGNSGGGTSLSLAALFRSSTPSFTNETAKTSTRGSTFVIGLTGLQKRKI